MQKVLLLFSGGLDSLATLEYLVNKPARVFPVYIDYGNSNTSEISVAKNVIHSYKARKAEKSILVEGLKIIPFDSYLEIAESFSIKGSEKSVLESPKYFAPNRNAFLITIAHAYCQTHQLDSIATGVMELDYKDCSLDYLTDNINSLNQGVYGKPIELITPFIDSNKEDIYKFLYDKGILTYALNATSSCYTDKNTYTEKYGRVCGECDSCANRVQELDRFYSGKSLEALAEINGLGDYFLDRTKLPFYNISHKERYSYCQDSKTVLLSSFSASYFVLLRANGFYGSSLLYSKLEPKPISIAYLGSDNAVKVLTINDVFLPVFKKSALNPFQYVLNSITFGCEDYAKSFVASFQQIINEYSSRQR